MINVKPALFYLALIFGLWTVYVATVYPFVESRPDAATRVILNESIRFGIFVLPVWIYLKFIARENAFRYLKLSENVARGIFWGVFAGIAYAALVLARASFFLEGGINFKRVPLEAWLTAITIAVFIEEIAFRGFLLRQFERVASFWAANALTAFLFVAIHFPGWILLGDSPLVPGRLIAMAEILFLGLLLGYVFKRSQSLWSCIIVHAVNNLLSTALFG
ncbi:MAG: CPBP family intramembrane metalloprotease [Acidobacteriota bacterium]|nr:CPBP family intramembrane metalloprotease [Acidobacteriota bacterium]